MNSCLCRLMACPAASLTESKICALLILLSLLGLPAPEAHAGSYTVVYSGGHENYQDSDGVSGPYPYSLDNNS